MITRQTARQIIGVFFLLAALLIIVCGILVIQVTSKNGEQHSQGSQEQPESQEEIDLICDQAMEEFIEKDEEAYNHRPYGYDQNLLDTIAKELGLEALYVMASWSDDWKDMPEVYVIPLTSTEVVIILPLDEWITEEELNELFLRTADGLRKLLDLSSDTPISIRPEDRPVYFLSEYGQ